MAARHVHRSNPNPYLKWEKSKEFNVGLDAQFLGGRLGYGLHLLP